jgi:hypothetical protein
MTDIPHDVDDSATPGDCHQADLVSEPETIWAWGVPWVVYCSKTDPGNQRAATKYRRWDLPRPEDAKRIRGV